MGISKGSRKVSLEHIEKPQVCGGPGTWGPGRGATGAEIKGQAYEGHFSGVPVMMILGLDKAGELSWESSNERMGAEGNQLLRGEAIRAECDDT